MLKVVIHDWKPCCGVQGCEEKEESGMDGCGLIARGGGSSQ